MKIEEISIPVPWGHISGKAWGDPDSPPVLVTHGRMDNAGSFDNLIPLLPDVFYYICIDLPSHGKSSHFPPHVPIHTLNYVMVYKLVLDYFKREKYILLGHSYGALIGQVFAKLYPEYVTKMVNIDCISAHHIEPSHYKTYVTKKFNDFVLIHQKGQTGQKNTYTQKEVIEKIRNGRFNQPLSFESARSIAQRILEPAGNGRYKLLTDHRMKAYFDPLSSFNYIRETFKLFPVTCPYLVIVAKNSPPLLSDMHPLIEEMEKWERTKVILLDVGHDVHMNQPELIVPYITEFLLKMEGKL